MKTAIACLAVLGVLLVSPHSARTQDGPVLTLDAVPARGPCSRTILPLKTRTLKAVLVIPGTEKRKVEFIWTGPGGEVYAKSAKIAFPERGAVSVNAWDSIAVAGEAAGTMPGWWSVDAAANGEKLSKRFLLTENRRVLGFVEGTKDDRLRMLASMDASDPDLMAVATAAAECPEEQTRVAAAKALKGVGKDWSAGLLKAAATDPSPAVRAAAVGPRLALGGGAFFEAAREASLDSSPEVRKALAQALAGAPDVAKAAEVLGTLIMDPDTGVSDAALASLSALDGPGVFDAIAMGLDARDGAFRKDVMAVLENKAGTGSAASLIPGLGDPDPLVRLRSLEMFVKDPPEDAAVEVVKLVDDPSENIALKALDFLVKKADAAAVAEAAGSRHAPVRKKAVEYLAGHDPSRWTNTLEAAVSDKDAGVRSIAVEGLVRAGEKGAPGLVTALSDKEPALRLRAAQALTGLKAEEAGPAMVSLFGDPDPVLRAQALEFLVATGSDALPEILVKAARDDDEGIRRAALYPLLKVQTPESSRALLTYLATADKRAKSDVINNLVAREDPVAEGWTMEAVNDPDENVRLKAAVKLWERGIRGPLIGLSVDPEARVRRSALERMAKSPGPDMLEALKTVMNFDTTGLRLMALRALGGIPGDEAGSVISSAVFDESSQVRELAKGLLFNRQDQGVVYGLASLALDEDHNTRVKAVKSLALIPGEAAERQLESAFLSDDPEVRAEVLDELGRRRSASLPRLLIKGVMDTDAQVRLKAVELAGGLEGDKREAVHVAMLSSPFVPVRLTGVRGLKGKGSPEASSALADALSDPIAGVRKEALSVLTEAGYEGLAGRLPGLVDDADHDVAEAALEQALKVKDAETRAGILLAAAMGPHTDLGRKAVEALVQTADARAIPAFQRHYREGYKRDLMLKGMAAVKGDEAADSLASAYRESGGDEASRAEALRLVSQDGGAEAAGVLYEGLSDPSEKVRLAAVEGLGRSPSPESIKALEGALDDAHPVVKSAALRELSKMEGGAAFSAMLPALKDQDLRDEALFIMAARKRPAELAEAARYSAGLEDARARAAAFKALAGAGLDVNSAALFVNDASPGVRLEAVRFMSGREGREAASWLLVGGAGLDGAERAATVKSLAKRDDAELSGALGLLFDRGAAKPGVVSFAASALERPELLESLVRMIPEGSDELLAEAAIPLMRRASPDDYPAMLAALEKAGPGLADRLISSAAGAEGTGAGKLLTDMYARRPDLKRVVLGAAAATGRAGDVLNLAIKDEDPEIRRAALMHVGGASEKDARSIITSALDDQEESVRLLAAGVSAERDFQDGLLRAASDASPAVRLAAVTGLGREKPGPMAVDALVGLASDPDKVVSDSALGALSGLGEDVPSLAWASLAGTENAPELKAAALKALGKRKDPAYFELFAKALASPEPAVREAGRKGLVAAGPAALPALYKLIGDEGAGTAALETIGEIGDPSSEGAVLSALPGLGGAARAAAVRTLGKTGGPESLEALYGIYSGGGGDEKLAVLRALGGMRLSGDEPVLIRMLGDAINSADDSARFYGAMAAGSLRAFALKEALEAASEAEESSTVKKEIGRAVDRLSNVKE